MSLELRVFSSTTIEREALVRRLANRGWSGRMLSEWPMLSTLGIGTVGNELVLGWCSKWASAPDEPVALDTLPADRYAVVALRAGQPDPISVRDLGHEEPRLADALNVARHLYTVSTSAGRSRFASSFQVAVWHALGEVTGGVLYDEVNGELSSYALKVGRVRDEAAPSGPDVSPASVGMEAPDFALPAHDGKEFSLRAHRGAPVTLWLIPSGLSSPVVIAEAEVLAKRQAMITNKTTLVGIGPFSQRDLAEHAARFGLRFPLLADTSGVQPSVAQKYDAYQQRLTVLIDSDGIVRDRVERGDPLTMTLDLIKRIRKVVQ